MKNIFMGRSSNWNPSTPNPQYKTSRRKTESGMEQTSTFLGFNSEEFNIDQYIDLELKKVREQRDKYDKYYGEIEKYFNEHTTEKVIVYDFNHKYSTSLHCRDEMPYLQMKAFDNFLKTIKNKYEFTIDQVLHVVDYNENYQHSFHSWYRITIKIKEN